jgi:SAM-dependent methyltransferase
MATDIALMLANLTEFFDFGNKTVVHVGAGGGQLIRYAVRARHVVAVDPDPAAIERLRLAVNAAQLGGTFTLRLERFETVVDPADVVFFEFCLHEMDDPDAMLRQARLMAPETVVIDHAPDSLWAWYVAETDKAARSWEAVERAGIRRDRRCSGLQQFANGKELLEKIQSQGEPAVSRALNHASTDCIEIEMRYRIALL